MAEDADISRCPTIVNLESINTSQSSSDCNLVKSLAVPNPPTVDRPKHETPSSPASEPASSSDWRGHVLQPLTKKYTNYILIVLFFSSGLIDSVAFNAWSCFVGMQTGNTIFTALGLSRQPISNHPVQYLKSLTSIGFFCIGSFFFAILHRRPFPSFVIRQGDPAPSLRRSVLLVSFSIQVVLIIIAAALVTAGVVSNLPFQAGQFSSGSRSHDGEYDRITRGSLNWADLAPIALLAFQASGQAALSRVLGINELPTIVLSTIYYDFMAEVTEILPHDPTCSRWQRIKREALRNEKRNRRFGSICGLFLGGLAGGFMFRSTVGMCGALWLAAALKLGIVIAWLIWPAQSKGPNSSVV